MTEIKNNPTPTPTPAAGPARWWLLGTITLLTIVADQISKAYVAAHLDPYDSWMPVDFIEPVFRFTHVHNTGAAFGIFPEGGMIFLVIALVVSVMILFFYRELPPGALLVRVGLGLQMGGALGNVIDRVRLGYVVDFFHVEYWPVFNVADSCIVIGVGLLMLEMLRDEYRQRQAARQEHSETPDEEVQYS